MYKTGDHKKKKSRRRDQTRPAISEHSSISLLSTDSFFSLLFFPSTAPHPSTYPSNTQGKGKKSSNHHLLILREFILGHRQIQRRRAFPRPAGDVVVGAVAGAEPAAKVARFADGHAA